MVGEVRDAESGSLLKTMVQSGHQVITTVHAASSIEVIERFASDEIGIPRQALASPSFLSALVYQRLVPKLCPNCSRPAIGILPASRLIMLETKFGIDPSGVRVADDRGCAFCSGHGGVHGVTVTAEIIEPTVEMQMMIREGKDAEAGEWWRSQRTRGFEEDDCAGKTALEHGLLKVAQGIVDPGHLEDAFEPLETYRIRKIKDANG
jgi:type II secretory ATPase GspE/PulE/Tfp pilus assembly ATPase PilB-like protein